MVALPTPIGQEKIATLPLQHTRIRANLTPNFTSLGRLCTFTILPAGGAAMRKLLVAGLALGLVALIATPADAFGKKRAGYCPAPSCEAPASDYTVAYVDQVRTGYRAEYRTRTVNVTVNRVVPRTVSETVKWNETVAVMTPTKRTETYYTCVAKQVPVTYNVTVPVVTQEKRTVT